MSRLGRGFPRKTASYGATPTGTEFPLKTVIDDFNRADGALGSNWTANVGNTALSMPTISGNAALADTSAARSAKWVAEQFGPDSEAFVTLGRWSDGDRLMLVTRLTDPGTSGYDRYNVLLVRNGASTEIYLQKVLNGSSTTLVETLTAPNLQAGDTIGLRVVGDQIAAFCNRAGSVSTLLSATDPTPLSASVGYVGFLLQETTAGFTVDNFGGGTLRPAGSVDHTDSGTVTFALTPNSATAFPDYNTTLKLVDDFNRSDQSPPGSPWSSGAVLSGNTALSISSNRLAGSGSGNNSNRIATSYGPDCYVSYEYVTVGGVGHDVGMFFRIQSIGAGATTYLAAGTGSSMSIFRYPGGTNLGNFVPGTLAAGDMVAVEAVGTRIRLYTKIASRSADWELRLEVYDSTISAAGEVGAMMVNTTSRIDNYRAGLVPLDTHHAVDSETVLVTLTPSAVEEFTPGVAGTEYTDSATVALDLQVVVTVAAEPFSVTLDDFERADQSPIGSPGWTSGIYNGEQLMIEDGELTNVFSWGSAYWSDDDFGDGADMEVWFEFADDPFGVLGGTQGSAGIEPAFRLLPYGEAPADPWCHFLHLQGNDAMLWKMENGGQTQVFGTASGVLPNWVAGDKFGVRAIGTTIELWVKDGSADWDMVYSWEDVPTLTTVGPRIGMLLNGAWFESFGGGAIVDDAPTETFHGVDSATVSLLFTPSATELEEVIDSATVSLLFTVSAVEIRERDDSATIPLTFTVSALENVEYVDSATARLLFTPSATELEEVVDSATVRLTFTVSALSTAISATAGYTAAATSSVGWGHTTEMVAASFPDLPGDVRITSIDVDVSYIVSPSDSVYVELRTYNNETGGPTDTVLATSAPITGSSLPSATGTLTNFPLDYSLRNTQPYPIFVVLRRTSSPTGSAQYRIANRVAAYAGATFLYSSSAWNFQTFDAKILVNYNYVGEYQTHEYDETPPDFESISYYAIENTNYIADDGWWLAQRFIPGSNIDVRTIGMNLQYVDLPDGTTYVEIRNEVSGKPGSVVASTTVPNNSIRNRVGLSDPPIIHELPLSASLVSGIPYYMVFRKSGGTSDFDVGVSYDEEGPLQWYWYEPSTETFDPGFGDIYFSLREIDQATDIDFTLTPSGTELEEAVDAHTINLLLTPSGVDDHEGAIGTHYTDSATITLAFTPDVVGETFHGVDAQTVSLLFTPSATELEEVVDAQTVRLAFTPSALEVREITDAATATLTFTPSALEAQEAVDAATISLRITPSAVEAKEAEDTATADLRFTVLSADVSDTIDTGIAAVLFTVSSTDDFVTGGVTTDSATVRLSLTPSSTEEAVGVDAATVPLTFTPSAVEIRERTDSATASVLFTVSAVEEYTQAQAYVDSATAQLTFTITAVEGLELSDAATVPLTFTVTYDNAHGYADSATSTLSLTPSALVEYSTTDAATASLRFTVSGAELRVMEDAGELYLDLRPSTGITFDNPLLVGVLSSNYSGAVQARHYAATMSSAGIEGALAPMRFTATVSVDMTGDIEDHYAGTMRR